MKTLSISRNDEGIVVERKNEFGAKFKSVYATENGLKECLDVYKTTDTIADYQLHVSEDLLALVINHINS
ncbi:hypothetical protein FHE72_23435 (plasmid) [Rossellomorea vietnamensis]|uniref:Uncharacterized protein n=1 Tax=Rossellomorea vietnamensis TaxID=218284 RepID=A0A6I6URJ6_9BACI|nr:hypothetical protein [Rossellomorea vietnamensis]QHE63947.1 hypothetical protein FHE72_23435 [Rossellomorea vietnamensis]